jgi:hypothetical protein
MAQHKGVRRRADKAEDAIERLGFPRRKIDGTAHPARPRYNTSSAGYNSQSRVRIGYLLPRRPSRHLGGQFIEPLATSIDNRAKVGPA